MTQIPVKVKVSPDEEATPDFPPSQAALEELLHALEDAWEGICHSSLDGHIRWTNRPFADWLAFSADELIGREWQDLFHPSDRATVNEAFYRMMRDGKAQFRARAHRKDDTRFEVHGMLVRSRGSPGFFCFLREGMAAKVEPKGKAHSQELQAEIERLKQLNQMRTQFINTAAHEFATPLTPLRLQTSLLKSGSLGELGEKQQNAVAILDRNMERLSKLVKDVLDVGRIEASRLIVERQMIDLAEVARQAVQANMPAAREAGLELSIETPETILVEGDPDRLTQVFFNLITNAIKFTPTGGTIRVRVLPKEASVLVEVQDTGLGISKEDFPKLFIPFSQVHDTFQRTHAGSGLGLSICQGIVHQHGGRIWAHSPGPGRGTKFSFVLPLPQAGPSAPAEEAGPGPHKIVRVDRRGRWNLFYFRCPQCGSRDIEIRLLKNRYDCNQCKYGWR